MALLGSLSGPIDRREHQACFQYPVLPHVETRIMKTLADGASLKIDSFSHVPTMIVSQMLSHVVLARKSVGALSSATFSWTIKFFLLGGIMGLHVTVKIESSF